MLTNILLENVLKLFCAESMTCECVVEFEIHFRIPTRSNTHLLFLCKPRNKKYFPPLLRNAVGGILIWKIEEREKKCLYYVSRTSLSSVAVGTDNAYWGRNI